jgi:hypothetical protein
VQLAIRGTRLAISRGMLCTAHSSIVALALALASAAGAQEFAPLAGFERVRGALAVAVDAASGRVAVGTRSSVWLAAPGAPAVRALRAGEVRDLAFGADGALWVASERGVLELAREAARPHALGPGTSGRATRLAWLGETLVVGTEDGLAARASGGAFARLNGAAPEGAVRALVASGERTLFAITGTEIARLVFDARGALVTGAAREALPAGDGAPLDLALLPDGDVLALRERGLARLGAAGRWERVPLALPPGAAPVRLLALASGVWIATDAGLLRAGEAAGPYERAAAPAGRLAIAALAASGSELTLAGPRGVLRGATRAPLRASLAAAPPPAQDDSAAREPAVLAVQRAALGYLALEPARMASLWARTRKSALAPSLELAGGYGGDRSHDRDWDETFTSGFDRTFLDRNRAHGRNFDAGVALRWQLGAAIYHPEEIDASREAREWIELRDEVLDEIAQLYFERRRAQVDSGIERDPHLAARLRLRADELAAGLDAWTGGWWSAQLGGSSPQSPTQESMP